MNKNKIIFTICLVVILIGGVIIIWWPRFKIFSAKNDELAFKQSELDAKEEYFRNIDDILAKIKDNQENFNKISAGIPDEFSAPDALNYLQKESGNNGLALKSISVGIPSVSKINPKIKENPIVLSASGSYPALKSFLDTIYKSSRMLEVQTIKFSTPPKESKQKDIYNFEMVIKAHSY